MQSFFHGDCLINETFLHTTSFSLQKKKQQQVTLVLFAVAWRSIAEAEASIRTGKLQARLRCQYLANSINLILIKIAPRYVLIQCSVEFYKSSALEWVELNSLPKCNISAIAWGLFRLFQMMKTFPSHQSCVRFIERV